MLMSFLIPNSNAVRSINSCEILMELTKLIDPFLCTVQTDKDNTMVVAERTATAMQFYAATGDIRKLLLVQRYLTLVADDNGDL